MKKFLILSIIATLAFTACQKATQDLHPSAAAAASTPATSTATATSPTPARLVANFSYTAHDPLNIFEFQPISFKNESTGAVKSVWEFGNTTKSTETTPTMSYPMHGYYTVKLTVYDASGQSQSITQYVSILCLYANGIHPNGGTSHTG